MLAAALGPFRDSLCELIIDVDRRFEHAGNGLVPIEIRGSLAGLTGFAQLRKLVVPWVLYLGFSPNHGRSMLGPLPRSLETLVLADQLRTHDQFNWCAVERQNGYDSDDNEDCCARQRAIHNGLRGTTCDAAPN